MSNHLNEVDSRESRQFNGIRRILHILKAADVLADAPSPAMASAREYLHLLVANAPGGDLTKGTVRMQWLN